MNSVVEWARDSLKWAMFELGAGYYSRKLACGPEAEIRHEFIDWLRLPSSNGHALSLLDLGCGPGHVTRALARRGYALTGTDRSPRLLRIAQRQTRREKLPIQFVRAPGANLPFFAGDFDAAFATGVIYFVENPLRVLREAVRVIRPGGFFASLDPHYSMSPSLALRYAKARGMSQRDIRKLLAWAVAAEMNRRFEAHELRALLAAAGLSQITLERHMGGMVWFSRGVVNGKPRRVFLPSIRVQGSARPREAEPSLAAMRLQTQSRAASSSCPITRLLRARFQ